MSLAGRFLLSMVFVLFCAAPGFAVQDATSPRVNLDGGTRPQTCCDGIPNFGTMLDFNGPMIDTAGNPILPGEQIGNRLMHLCVYFAPATFPPAPVAPVVEVIADGALPPGCQNVASGLPHFTGNETMQFTMGGGMPFCVSAVGAQIGFCDAIGTCFMAVFDACGNELDRVWNTVLGFEFLSIVRPVNDIHFVIWGDTGDLAGSAVNCITYNCCIQCQFPSGADESSWTTIKALYR